MENIKYKSLEIQATFTEKVQVDPMLVIQKLIDHEIGWNNWVVEKDGKFYKEYSSYHNTTEKEEISKEVYEYVQSLQLILKFLFNKSHEKD